MLLCIWNLAGFWWSTWAHSQVLPGVAKFLRVDVACWKPVISSSSDQCPQPISFYPPWQLVPRPRGDFLLSVMCQVSVCFGESYLPIDSKALLLLAFSIHWAAHLPLGAELRFLFVSFWVSPWRIFNTQLFFCPIWWSLSWYELICSQIFIIVSILGYFSYFISHLILKSFYVFSLSHSYPLVNDFYCTDTFSTVIPTPGADLESSRELYLVHVLHYNLFPTMNDLTRHFYLSLNCHWAYPSHTLLLLVYSMLLNTKVYFYSQ